ncbi:MAG: 6-phosphofructokinase, partial [Planctomycetota bacterium]
EPTRDPKSGELVTDGVTEEVIQRRVIKLDKLVSRIADTIIAREKEGKRHGVVVMAEGLGEYFPLEELRRCIPTEQFEELKPDTFGHFPISQVKFTGRIAQLVNQELERRGHKRIKINPLQFGYEVRCHQPTAFDIILGSQLGVGAYRALVEEKLDGVMVSVGGQLSLVYEPFENLIDMSRLRAHARLIDPNEDFHQLARYLESRVD